MVLEGLEAYGLERMTDDDIAAFLATQRVGTLGLPTEGAPYMVPLSFGYDPEDDADALYFTYLLGSQSRKLDLTRRAETAGFLVYSVESMFNWRSVSLTGTLQEVPQAQWGSLEDVLSSAWRPELFQSAGLGGEITVYRFDIDERVGIRHTGLAEGFEA